MSDISQQEVVDHRTLSKSEFDTLLATGSRSTILRAEVEQEQTSARVLSRDA